MRKRGWEGGSGRWLVSKWGRRPPTAIADRDLYGGKRTLQKRKQGRAWRPRQSLRGACTQCVSLPPNRDVVLTSPGTLLWTSILLSANEARDFSQCGQGLRKVSGEGVPKVGHVRPDG